MSCCDVVENEDEGVSRDFIDIGGSLTVRLSTINTIKLTEHEIHIYTLYGDEVVGYNTEQEARTAYSNLKRSIKNLERGG